jgi:hypothetical protein
MVVLFGERAVDVVLCQGWYSLGRRGLQRGPGAYVMRFGFGWWVLGMWLALAYFIFLTHVSR